MQHTRPKFLPVRPEWLDLLVEDVLDPQLPIIDAHHHLWDRPAWPYLLDAFLDDIRSGHRIVATVFVQCLAMYRQGDATPLRVVGETEFANGIAAMSASGQYGDTRICDGIVSYADLRLTADVERVLDAHIARGGDRFKGIRQIAAWDANPDAVNPETQTSEGMLADPRFRQGFAALAARGLSFDAWVFHTQLPDLVALARAFPATPIVLNHLGTPLGIAGYERHRDDTRRLWLQNIQQLSGCQNVMVKLGGLGMRPAGMGFADAAQPLSSAQLADRMRPWVEPCIEHFGVHRCMFESNFPVDKASYSYRTCWNSFKRLASGASASERQALFHDTAARFYRLGGPGQQGAGADGALDRRGW